MSTSPTRVFSPAEYLALERELPTKHEYCYGEMFAMSGASRKHNQLTFNLAGLLYSQVKDRDCLAFVGDMRTMVASPTGYFYPDGVITCDKPEFEDSHLDTLLNPQVIIEVLSPTTESYDRGWKFELYRQIPSLREYVLVTQDRAHVEHFVRRDDGQWLLSEVDGLDAAVALPAVACGLPLRELYAKVEFPPQAELFKAAGLLAEEQAR
jgi:Uma2 family endonuclease